MNVYRPPTYDGNIISGGSNEMNNALQRSPLGLIAPNLHFAPYEFVQGIRRFHLIAGQVHQELVKGVTIRAWGFNGTTPGPVIVVQQGERVQIAVHNRLSEATAIHWHGLIVPDTMDGVPDIGAGPLIQPGQTFVYDFVIRQSGTYMYHAHAHDAKQEMMGLSGMFIALPPKQEKVDLDYVMLLQEWSVAKGQMPHGGMMQMGDSRKGQGMSEQVFDIDPMSMDFNYFTINGKSYPDTEPLHVRYGERIRIRLGNLSMNSHPMHLHGHMFQVTATDGSPVLGPLKSTINVAPGETYDIEFVANNPGTWVFHCHKPHHMTNAHQSEMGGMLTLVKYR